jgi:cytochrome P450
MNLPFLNAVVNESLRLGTPFFLPRVIPEGGVTIDGNFIPEGTMAAFAAFSQQTSPDNFYPDPLVSINRLSVRYLIMSSCVGFYSGTVVP